MPDFNDYYVNIIKITKEELETCSNSNFEVL